MPPIQVQKPDGHSAQPYDGGTDVGLDTCKRLAELLGGDLFVTSAPGAAIRFDLQLPYKP